MIENILDKYERVKVGKQEIELWKLKSRIRDGEDQLQIEHRNIDDMTNEELADYFIELAREWKNKEGDSQTAKIPKKDETDETDKEPEETESPKGIKSEDTAYKGLPSDVMLKAIKIGAPYDVSGEEICDRYLQICRKKLFDTESVRDLNQNVLETWNKGCELAFIEPIKRGFLSEPPLFYTNSPNEQIAKQLDNVIPNWKKLREPALCYLYHTKEKECEEEIYCPLGKW